MNEYSLRLAKPHCDACHKPKNDMMIREEVLPNTAISLADRLQQTIQQANEDQEDEI